MDNTCGFDADLSFSTHKLKSLSFLVLCPFSLQELQDIHSLPNNTGPWSTMGFLPPQRALLLQWPSLISSGLFRASLFSSNPLLSGNRVRSGDVLLVVELQYCRQPSLYLGWGLESLRSPLSCKEEPSVRAVCGAFLGSSWKLLPSVVQKYAGNYSSLLLYWGCQLQGQVVPFVSQ